VSAHPALLRPAERLARSTPSEIEDARRRVSRTLAAARSLAAVLPSETGGDDPARSLARRLAALAPRGPEAAPPTDLAAAEAAFRAALVATIDAVRTCRQTLHVSGACWFADVAGEDGCGELLRIGHALS
jgi:Lon protease-like protein